MSEPNKVELVNHAVIERQLLTHLSDKSKVAILATEEDLDHLISALICHEMRPNEPSDLRLGLEQLKREAFL